MKKWGLIIAVVVVFALLAVVLQGSGIFSGARAADNMGQPAPKVVVWPAVMKLHSGTNMLIMGSGFDPGQELYVLFPAGDGTVSNIVAYLKPTPEPGMGITADERGNLVYAFNIGRLERVGIEGVVDLSITDLSYNVLATTPVGLADPDGRSRLGVYARKAPDYVKNPDDPRPAPWAAPFFEYPERP